jgi:hypothetical protein
MNDPSEASGSINSFLAGLRAKLRFDGKMGSCETIDLSLVGGLLSGGFPAIEGSEVTLTLSSSSGDLEFEADARVTFQSETQLGIEFGQLNETQKSSLEALLSRAQEGIRPASLESLDRDSSTADIKAALKKIPIPHRINLARRATLLDRGFLVHDESPQVLEALARNPQLIQQEVVQLLRLPTLLPTTLEVLSRDARWMSSEELKITIATHPRVTFHVAERLVKTLSIVGIRRVIRRPGLNPAIKQKLVQTIPHKQLQGW